MLHRTLIFATTILFVFSSCVSVRETIESGNYDRGIDLAIGHLKGKKNKKEEYVKGLELALEKANARDLNTIDNLIAENNPSQWERINSLYKGIQYRQSKIYPLLPLVAKSGYTANLKLVDVAVLERDSRQKADEYVYNHALDLLEKGKNGNRVAARDAYNELKRLKTYNAILPNTDNLMAQAQELGTTHIFVEMRNQSNVALPRDFEYRMMHLAKSDLESAWLSYHFDIKDRQNFDYKVVVKMNNIDVSPERFNTRDYIDEAKVEDGWEYVLNSKGNVMKDSLGNDIKRKRYSYVRAYVHESYQTKLAKVGGEIEIYDFNTKALLDKDRLITEVVFDHYASTFNGDRRALSPETCRRIGNQPIPFPSDASMLTDAADRLKPMLKERLKVSRMIV